MQNVGAGACDGALAAYGNPTRSKCMMPSLGAAHVAMSGWLSSKMSGGKIWWTKVKICGNM